MSRLRGAAGAVRTQARSLVGSLREGARNESRRRRLTWIAVAALLVIGPLAFNLAREPDFEASVQIFPREVSPYPPVYDPDYYEALLADPELREQMRLNVGQGVVKYENVSISRGPGANRLTMTAEADRPEKAQRFINALAPQIAGATQRQLGRAAQRDIERVGARLGDTPPGSERRTLRGRLRRLNTFGEFPPPRVLPGAAAPLPQLERWTDRLVSDLPGDFRSRPSPVWAALSGLLVAATLWVIGLLLVPPRRL
jgi:hypothetical protein